VVFDRHAGVCFAVNDGLLGRDPIASCATPPCNHRHDRGWQVCMAGPRRGGVPHCGSVLKKRGDAKIVGVITRIVSFNRQSFTISQIVCIWHRRLKRSSSAFVHPLCNEPTKAAVRAATECHECVLTISTREFARAVWYDGCFSQTISCGLLDGAHAH
jgi:hypothetical protein